VPRALSTKAFVSLPTQSGAIETLEPRSFDSRSAICVDIGRENGRRAKREERILEERSTIKRENAQV
jgi:hypothetical protein